MRRQILFACLIGILAAFRSVAAQELSVITSVWAPYQMMENGKLTGMGAEIVQATLSEAGIKAGPPRVYPFARALLVMKTAPNTLLYTIVRTPEREPQFTWIGPIIPHVRIVMHKLRKRSDIVLNSLEEAKRYRTGTTREAVGHQFLLRHGFIDGKQVEAVDSNTQSIQKFFMERVDLEVSEEMNFRYEVKQQGYASADSEIALELYENQGYMVLSKQTPAEIVDRVRSAFEQIKAAGIVDAIIDKYARMYQ